MSLIVDTAALTAFCQEAHTERYVTVDTEFLRDKTYWPQLCLVQIATTTTAVAIDPLAPGIDLAPLYALMADPAVLKVFHAARQDIEIFVNRAGAVPQPLFDTQVAAMVCGFGDSVSYETLVNKLARRSLDKSSRFTDWAQRPLSARQLDYALADVIHLRPIYEALAAKLEESGRAHWLQEEMATLTGPATYSVDPWESWRRIKHRTNKPRFLAVLREVAAWREREVQSRDMPRSRLLKDESLLDIAGQAPATRDELARIRGLGRGLIEGRMGDALLAAIARAKALPKEQLPPVAERDDLPPGLGPTVDLLRVLLKAKCDTEGIAPRLVAGGDDLDRIAADDAADVPALHGWRREIFGEDALRLKRGEIALAVRGGQVRIIVPR
jgi:ribonuclease D